MKIVFAWMMFLCLIFSFTIPTAHNSYAQVPISAPARLVVSARQDIKIIGQSAAVYDFGLLSPFQVTTQDDLIIRHTFALKNIDSKPVVVSRLRTMSPYTQAAIVQEEVASQDREPVKLPVVISPNAQVFIQTSVDTRELRPGNIQQTVLVYTEEHATPEASLTTSGILKSVILFSPPAANFGQVPLGRRTSLIITMTLDPQFCLFGRPIPEKELPSMICTRQDVQVITLATSANKSNSTAVPKERRLNNVMTFQVTLLPQQHLGEIDGELLLVPKPEMFGAALVRKVSIHLSGVIVGNDAMP